MIACLIPFLIGLIGLQLIPNSNPYGRLVCLWISFAYSVTWTLSMAAAITNAAGHTKKITTNAILLIGYCVGNFIGPFFFKKEEAPTYSLGISMMFFCCALQIVCLATVWFIFWRRNKAKRTLRASFSVSPEQAAIEAQSRSFLDETDKENPYFEYIY